jgi:hypothetical protein
LIFLLAIGVHSHLALGRTLSAIGTFINRLLRPILRREALDISNAYSFAQDINHGLRRIQRAPGGLLIPGALALSSKALLVSILFLVFLAFQQPFSIGTVIAGTGVGYLFTIISPTPSGIGIVEGAMALTLRSLRVPLAAATVIALAFRGFTFWLTLFYGMFAMRWISRQD